MTRGWALFPETHPEPLLLIYLWVATLDESRKLALR